MEILSTIKHTNVLRHKKLESTQYNAALEITEAMRGTSREQLYRTIGLESLESRR